MTCDPEVLQCACLSPSPIYGCVNVLSPKENESSATKNQPAAAGAAEVDMHILPIRHLITCNLKHFARGAAAGRAPREP